jgi:hypothetical protein
MFRFLPKERFFLKASLVTAILFNPVWQIFIFEFVRPISALIFIVVSSSMPLILSAGVADARRRNLPHWTYFKASSVTILIALMISGSAWYFQDAAETNAREKRNAHIEARTKEAEAQGRIYDDYLDVIGVGSLERLEGVFVAGKQMFALGMSGSGTFRIVERDEYFFLEKVAQDQPHFVGEISGKFLFILESGQVNELSDGTIKEYGPTLCFIDLSAFKITSCAKSLDAGYEEVESQILGEDILVALEPKDNQLRLITLDKSLEQKNVVTRQLSNPKEKNVDGSVYPLGEGKWLIYDDSGDGYVSIFAKNGESILEPVQQNSRFKPTVAVDSLKNIYLNDGEIKIGKDFKIEDLRALTSKSATGNHYAEFKDVLATSRSGDPLASKRYLAELLSKNGFQGLKNTPISPGSIYGAVFTEKRHLLIVGNFRVEKDGVIYINLVDAGLISK